MATIAEASGGFDMAKASKLTSAILQLLDNEKATVAEAAAAASYVFIHAINGAPASVREKVRETCIQSIRQNTWDFQGMVS